MDKILNDRDLFGICGQVALVTGAGNGLGQGYAHIFAEAGCRVICADPDPQANQSTVDSITSNGGIAHPLTVDVRDIASIKAMAKSAIAVWGRVDILINNAGLEDIADYVKVTPDQYDKIHSVNLRGLFFVGQAIAKEMIKSGGGKIINIGSLGSYIGLPQSSVYCSTKGGVMQLSKTMALELAPHNIQVNCLAPGYLLTPMTQPFYDDPQRRQWIEGRIPLGRWGTVADLAGPILFLASPASDYVTGVTLTVDGGWLAG